MLKARMLSVLMLVCLLVLGICSWAGAEEVIIIDKALTEREAVPADEPIISGAISPMLGESYTYTITHADLVDNLTVTLYETEPVPNSNQYYLSHGQTKTLDANDSFQHTFTVEGKFVVRISFTKNGESVNRNLWVDSVDRTAQLGQKVTEVVQACIQSGASTDYEKAVWLHDYLTSHAYYDYSFTEYGPDGVLLKGYGVCDSYSKAYQMLLNEFGIPNHRQEGMAGGDKHAWNVVYLNGQWCHIDATWDDPGQYDGPVSGGETHHYFGLPDSLMGVDHDYSITYPCNSLDNMYYVRNGLPALYSKIIDEGGFGTVGLLTQAAQGLDTISYDVSSGYCVSYEATSTGTSIRRSTDCAHIVFPAMAYLKSRTPMIGPNGVKIYYSFTYENNALTGTLESPMLNVTYEVDGNTILPGSAIALGQTITVNWEITNPDGAPDGFSYYLFLETPVTLGEDNTVDASMIQKQGGFIQGSEQIMGTAASGTFTITPQEGDRLCVQKSLKLYANDAYTTVETWDEDVFTLTGSETQPLDAEAAFTVNAEKRVIQAAIMTNADQPIQAVWYVDEETDEHRIGESVIGSGENAQTYVNRNVEHAVLLVLTLSDSTRGLSCKKVFSVVPEGFATLTADACGLNLTWAMDNGTVILTGSGAMYDYASRATPWYDLRSSIQKIVLDENVTSIGDHAFEDCTALTEVSNDEGEYRLARVGNYAFNNCTLLEDFCPGTMEEELFQCPLREIGACAFQNSGISGADLEAAQSIGISAFDGCSNLQWVSFPRYCTEIPERMLAGTGIRNVLLQAQITSIGAEAFADCTQLSSLKLNDGLRTIHRHAFSGCTALTAVTIPQSVKYIADDDGSDDDFAFYGIGDRIHFTIYNGTPIKSYAQLHVHLMPNVTIIDSDFVLDIDDILTAYNGTDTHVTVPSFVAAIGENAFRNNTTITEVVLPANITQIGVEAFKGCTSLTTINLDNITTIEEKAFDGCNALTTIAKGYYNDRSNLLPNVHQLGSKAFSDCPALTWVAVGNQADFESDTFGTDLQVRISYENAAAMAKAEGFGLNAVRYCENPYYIVDENLTLLSYMRERASYITLPEPIRAFGNEAFRGVAFETDSIITVSGPIASIGDYAFSGINADVAYRYYSSVDGLVNHFSGLTSIGEGAFLNNPGFTRMWIPESVESIGDNAFDRDEDLLYVIYGTVGYEWARTNGYNYQVIWPQGFTADNDGVLTAYSGNAADVVIPEGITVIGDAVFKHHTEIEHVTISDTVTSISDAAFEGCTALASVSFGGNSALEQIGADAFRNTELTAVDFPSRLRQIGDRAFLECNSLASITFPNALEAIGDQAFQGCPMTELILPENLITIGSSAFEGALISGEISIPSSVTWVGGNAVANTGIQRVVFLGTQTELSGAVTDPSTQPEAVIYAVPVSETAKSISTYYDSFVDADNHAWTYVWAFQNSGRNWKSSYTDAYSGAPSQYTDDALLVALNYSESDQAAVTVLAGVGVLHDHLLANHYEITDVNLPSSLRIIDDYAFSHAEYLTGITLPEGTLSLGVRAFEHCKAMSSVTIPDSLNRLSDYTFDGCLQVPGIVLPDHMTFVGDNVLGDVAGARTFTVNISSDTVRLLGNYSFFYDRQHPEYRYRWVSGTEMVYDPVTGGFQSFDRTGLELDRYLGHAAEIQVDSRVVGIGRNAFYWHNDSTGQYVSNTTLEKITFPEGMQYIGVEAFSHASALKEVSFPSTLTEIRTEAFAYCPIESLTIPDSVISIDLMAFAYTRIPQVTLKNDGIEIGDYAFTLPTMVYCGLESNTAHRLSDNYVPFVANDLDAEHALLEGCALRYISADDGTETLCLMGYYGGQAHFRLHDTIKSISGDVQLNGARIVADLDSDEAWVASRIEGNEGVPKYGFTTSETDEFNYVMNGEGTARLIGYYGTSRHIETIPGFVTEIAQTLFTTTNTDFQSIDPIVLAFKPTSREAALLENIDCYFRDPDDLGIIMTWQGGGEISSEDAPAVYAYRGTAEEVSIPEGVKSIVHHAFCPFTDDQYYAGVSNCKSVTLPVSLRSLGYECLAYMPDLEQVTFLGHLESIPGRSFYQSGKLRSVSFMQGVERIEDSAFEKCTSLTTVTGTEQTVYYGCSAFEYDDLYSIVIADQADIGSYAFHQNRNLSEITFMGDVTAIRPYAFNENALFTIHIPGSVELVDEYAFSGQSQLSSIIVDGDIQRMAGSAITGNSQLTEMTIRGRVEEMESYAITATGLHSLRFEGGLGTTASNAVETKSDLVEIVFGEGTQTLGSRTVVYPYTLSNNRFSMKDVYLPASLTSIAEDAILLVNDAFVHSDLFRIHAPLGSYAAHWVSEKAGVFYDGAFGYTYDTSGRLLMTRYTGGADAAAPFEGIDGIDNSHGDFSHVRLIADIGSDLAHLISDVELCFTPSAESEWDYRYIGGKLYGVRYHGSQTEITSLPSDVEGILPDALADGVRFVCVRNVPMAHIVPAFYEPSAPEWKLRWNDTVLTLVRYEGAGTEIFVFPEGIAALDAGAFDEAVHILCSRNDPMAHLVVGFYEASAPEWKLRWNDTVLTLVKYEGAAAEVSVFPEGIAALDAGAFDETIKILCSRNELMAHLVSGFYDPAYPEWKLRWNENVLTLVKYTGSETELTSFPEGVTAVDEGAFSTEVSYICSADSSMAKTLGAIGYSFFTDGEHSLMMRWDGDLLNLLSGENAAGSVVIPEGTADINWAAFENNSDITEVSIPGSVRKIGGHAFYNCESLGRVILHDGLTEIGDYAFYNSPIQSELHLPDSVTTIGTQIVSGGWLYLPDSVSECSIQTDPYSVFVHADSLTARSLGSGKNKDSYYEAAFTDTDDHYLYAWLNDHLYLVGGNGGDANRNMFREDIYGMRSGYEYANQLKNIVLPSTLRDLWSENFGFFGGKTQSITFPEGLAVIPSGTDLSVNLQTVVIPRSVTSIDDNAFGEGLMAVYGYGGTEAEDYANRREISFVDMDADLEDNAVISPEQQNTVLHAGETVDLHNLVTVLPALSTPYALSASSGNENVLRVQGDQITAIAPGTTTLNVWITDHEITEISMSITVYNPVASFEVPEDGYINISDGGKTFSVTNVMPVGSDPNFIWTDSNQNVYGTGESCWISLSSRVQRTITVTSHNGISKTFIVIGYQTLGNLTVSTGTEMKVGQTATPIVKIRVDSTTRTNPRGLYMLTSSDENVIVIGENGTITAVGAGTATVTAQHIQDMDGSRARSVTISVAAVTELRLPAALKVIEEEAFMGTNAERVIIPNGAATIGSRAFADSRVSMVVIPDSVTSIAMDAFSGVSGLTVQCDPGSAAEEFAQANGYQIIH